MTLLIRPVPEHRPSPRPLPLPQSPRDDQPMLDLTPPIVVHSSGGPRNDRVRALAGNIAHVIVEVLAGRRPCGQLAGWASDRVMSGLGRVVRSGGTRALRVASVHCQRPHPDAIEVVVRFEETGGRCGAIGLGLRRHRRRWRCDAIALGPEFSPSSRGTS